MTSLPAAGYISDNARTQGERKQFLEDLRSFAVQGPGGSGATELTVAAGTITPTGSIHTVDTEGDAPADDLDALNPANLPVGARVTLYAAASNRVVTVRTTQGGLNEIITIDNNNVVLSSTRQNIELELRADQKWYELRRSFAPTQSRSFFGLEPQWPLAFDTWHDTVNGARYVRNGANNAWLFDGLIQADRMKTGVLQEIVASTNVDFTSASGVWQDIGLEITGSQRTKTGSRLLLTADIAVRSVNSSGNFANAVWRLVNANTGFVVATKELEILANGATQAVLGGSIGLSGEDTGPTSSSSTYLVQQANLTGTAVTSQYQSRVSSLILREYF